MSWRSHNGTAPMADKIENVVGRSCTVRGDLFAEGAFRVDGAIEGSVESKTAVVIGESGAVTGNVRAVDILVAGKIHGNACASGHLEIMATGTIEGDIDARSLRVETGGSFAGTSHMGTKGATAQTDTKVPPLPPPLTAVK